MSTAVIPTNAYGLYVGNLDGTNIFPIFQSGTSGTNSFATNSKFAVEFGAKETGC